MVEQLRTETEDTGTDNDANSPPHYLPRPTPYPTSRIAHNQRYYVLSGDQLGDYCTHQRVFVNLQEKLHGITCQLHALHDLIGSSAPRRLFARDPYFGLLRMRVDDVTRQAHGEFYIIGMFIHIIDALGAVDEHMTRRPLTRRCSDN